MADIQRRTRFESTPMVHSIADDGLLTSAPTIDVVLGDHASDLGHDFTASRDHVYRVLNLCTAIVGSRGNLEQVAVAAAFDVPWIWKNKTFNYISPSLAPAREYRATRGHEDWIAEIERMIADPHMITPSSASPDSLVEPFRRADWIDVTCGLRTFGVPRPFIHSVIARWPSTGFHWRLVTLTLDRLRTHPLSPLPMVKL